MKKSSAQFRFPSLFFWVIILGASLESEAFGQIIGCTASLLYLAQSIRDFVKRLA